MYEVVVTWCKGKGRVDFKCQYPLLYIKPAGISTKEEIINVSGLGKQLK